MAQLCFDPQNEQQVKNKENESSLRWIAIKKIKYMIALIAGAFALYFAGFFNILLGRLSTEEFSTGRFGAWQTLFDMKVLKFNLFYGIGDGFFEYIHRFVDFGTAGIATEFPILCLLFKVGVIGFIAYIALMLLIPCYELLKRKNLYGAACIGAYFFLIATYGYECQREFLHQVDLLSPSRTGVTEAEYWAQRRLDEKKQKIETEGFTPNPTKFQTQKQLIRDAVAAAREKAISYEDFQDILQDEYNIFVKTQRGRYSYLPPERNKFISERSLGESCKRECLEGFFVQNAEKNLRYKEEPILIFTTRTRLRLVVDLQENVKAQENLAYALKVKISNLQKMAETLVWVQENNINDLTELNDLCKTAQANAQAAYERLSQAEDELYKTNEQIHYAGQYLSTKEVQQQFAKAIFKKKFRAEHSKELDAYAESVKYFREENDGKLPSLKSLKKRKEELIKEIVEKKKAYAPLKEESRRLEIASDNVYSIFRKTNEMKSDLAWKREWEANVREKARQEQARQEQRERQPKRKKRSYDMSL